LLTQAVANPSVVTMLVKAAEKRGQILEQHDFLELNTISNLAKSTSHLGSSDCILVIKGSNNTILVAYPDVGRILTKGQVRSNIIHINGKECQRQDSLVSLQNFILQSQI
jgi:hypothetical protein